MVSARNCHTFEVPLPPRGLSSNARVHFRERARLVKDYRELVWALAQETRPIPITPVMARVSILFGIKGARRTAGYCPRDVPNAVDAFKAGFDGLVDAGWLADDSRRHMQLGSIEITSDDGPWVRVTVEEVPE